MTMLCFPSDAISRDLEADKTHQSNAKQDAAIVGDDPFPHSLRDMGDLHASVASSWSVTCSDPPDLPPVALDPEMWAAVEYRTQEILYTIQPSVTSEQTRKGVIDNIKGLLKHHYGVEVLPFGSVPLRTYLPDGDIDLTVLIQPNMEETLARDICRILKQQEENPEYPVKDIQYIQAQVKVVKCCIKDIAVDISFNQMAGLCAFHFLEQIDQFIGKDHLLKRSIILIKAWCIYESRILGAQRGLISTYAIEILVLHIINLFHSSLPGPLAVLHRFLDYYSKFDWEEYGVSIDGPIPISYLPNITVISSESEDSGLLLSQEFKRRCIDILSASIRTMESKAHEFPVKHLNIVDPLKTSNNLGRSVSKGCLHRIEGALSLGALKLSQILRLPGQSMFAQLENFFRNTLNRNGRGQRADIQAPVPAFGTGRSEVCDLHGSYGSCYRGFQPSQVHGYSIPYVQSPSWFLQQQPSLNLMPRRRGTGTYIPQVASYPYRNLQSSVRLQTPSSQTRGQWAREGMDDTDSPPETVGSGDGICSNSRENKVAQKTEISENAGYLDLSLDQFPHLPFHMKSISSEIQGSCDPICKSPEMKDPEAIFDLKFGAFRCSPLVLQNSVAETAEQMQQTSTECHKQLICRDQYQDEDFPPLCP